MEFESINAHVLDFLHKRLPEIYEGEPLIQGEEKKGFESKASLFGEAEGDITRSVSLFLRPSHPLINYSRSAGKM